jgi:trk system potassium uptake protein TrkA
MRRIAVIGLGRFGLSLTKALFESGHEVVAIDRDKDVVQRAKEFSTQAILANAADKETLVSVGIQEMDTVVVGMGTPLDHSILVTLYLKELGVKEIVVKAVTEDHGKILRAIGATEVVFPEKDMAVKLAKSIGSPSMIDFLALHPGFSIMEISPPPGSIGKTLKDLQLRNTYGIQILAIKELIPERLNVIPPADFVIKDSDILVVMGKDEDLRKIVSLTR